MLKKFICWVFPGVEPTYAKFFRFKSAFKIEDFPTFERPTNTTSGKSSFGNWFEFTADNINFEL